MFENKNKRIEKIRETVKKIREQLTMKQIVFLSLLVGIRESQIHIAEQVIRFHIRANSDSKEDQEEKMMVKKQVVEYLQPLMKQATSVQEGRKILSAYKEEIKEVAEKALETTSNRTVQVCLTKEKFPMKRYGDLVFPPGEYEALRVQENMRHFAWILGRQKVTIGGVLCTHPYVLSMKPTELFLNYQKKNYKIHCLRKIMRA